MLFDEPGRRGEGVTPGRGAYLDGNILWDAPANFEDAYVNDPQWGTLDITVNRSILPASDLFNNGIGNLNLDPRLIGTNGVLYAHLTNLFQLGTGSPAHGTGPNGSDMGAAVPSGVTLAGEPQGTTWKTNVTLFAGGAGYVNPGLPDLTNHYRYRVNGGAWSDPVEISQPIALTGLTNGTYTVFAVGQNSAGVWQSTNAATASRTWTVNTNSGRLRINEVLASNTGILENVGTFPDAIELFNDGGQPVNLSGHSLTDNPAIPRKYVFPPSAVLAAEAYLTVYADNNLAKPGIHTGFSLKQDGDDLYLFNPPAAGGAVLDSVTFGPQLPNQSIGRRADGEWRLTQPTFGGANQVARIGEPARLRINEWLAAEQGLIGLADTTGRLIDTVFYGPQWTDASQGRSPSGGDAFAFFAQLSPGVANPETATADFDADGPPDAWENLYFGATDDPRSMGSLDPDGDQLTNLQEWLCGTNPVDAASYLHVNQVTRDGASVRIQFFAVAGKTYSIVYRDSVTGGPWFKLPDVVAQLTGGEQTVIDSTVGATMLRVYRLVTPRLP